MIKCRNKVDDNSQSCVTDNCLETGGLCLEDFVEEEAPELVLEK